MIRHQASLLTFLLVLLPGAAFGAGESSLQSIYFMPGNYVSEGVKTQVIVFAESAFSPPGRIRGIARVGDEIRLEFVRPLDSKQVANYSYALEAELPKLEEGDYQIRVYDVALPPAAPALLARTLHIVNGGFELAYAGPAAPTEEDEIAVRLDHRPCDGHPPPGIDRADFHIRLRGSFCFEPAPEGYEIGLGRLAAGNWLIELEVAEAGLEQQLELQVAPAPPAPGVVLAGDFEVEVEWRTALGEEGPASLVQPPSPDSALFYFFTPANWELMLKVLDGCAINGHYWVFGAASTDVGYTVDIRRRGSTQTFQVENPIGTAAPAITEIEAFPCDPAAPSATP